MKQAKIENINNKMERKKYKLVIFLIKDFATTVNLIYLFI